VEYPFKCIITEVQVWVDAEPGLNPGMTGSTEMWHGCLLGL